MLFFEEDIPLDIKLQLRDYWHDMGLEDRMGIQSRLMAERIMVWQTRHPQARPVVEWDARMSARMGGFCATFDLGGTGAFEMMLYAARPFGDNVDIAKFVQVFYATTVFTTHQMAMRPDTMALMAGGMARHELCGPASMAA